jgi:aryl-alcohol dehydrogenase-like predicted oxidoreductase
MSVPTMASRALGELQVSVVGLGCNNFGGRVDAAGTRAVVDAALENGVTFFDTADIYGGRGGSERLLGEALRGRRDQVVLTTKFGMNMGDAPGYPDAPRGSPEYIEIAIAQSLKRLGTDHIELYQYHQPDGVTPIAETLGALHELVQAGIVRCLGASNFSGAQLEEAAAVAERDALTPFVSVQNEYSLLKRDLERDVTPVCERLGIAILPFFPLASGLLTGKYRRGEAAPAGTRLHGRGSVADDATFAQLEQLAGFAQERGIEVVEVAIAALAAQPMVASVIAGATKPEQVAANVRAARWTPSPEDLAELDAIFPSPRR